jgi:hypothetical protein
MKIVLLTASVILAAGSGVSVSAPPSSLALVGTVTKIFPLGTTLPNWGVTIHVERVAAGVYSKRTFTFAVHSPSLVGLEVGHRYSIDASTVGGRYAVSEVRGDHEKNARACSAELDRCWQLDDPP